MSLPPILLPYGSIAVYGNGLSMGISGLQTDTTTNVFATIYFIGQGMDSAVVGNSILFKQSDVVCRLVWDNGIYPIIPSDKILGTEVFT